MVGLEELMSNTERFKSMAATQWAGIKVDVIGDSSLLAHVGATTSGVTMNKGKLVKPPNWSTSVADLHEGIKRFVGVNIALDMCVEGGTTCQGLARLADEVWSRALVETGPHKVIRIAVVSWCCNDHSTFNKQTGGKHKCTAITAAMRAAAESLCDRLERYDAGIVIGPGHADI